MKKLALFSQVLFLSLATVVWAQDQGNGNGGPGYEKSKDGRHRAKGHGNRNNQRHFNRANTGNNQRAQGQAYRPGASGHNFNHPRAVSPQLRNMGITHLPPTLARGKMLSADPQHSTFVQPRVGPGGGALHASVIEPRGASAVVIQSHMNAFAHNAAFTAQINLYNSNEIVANHYYWHTWGGYNYCHFYDPWGYHWYGWYWGGQCFWTRWYAGNWWWYDPVLFRWCYWYNGWWWWQDPYQVDVVYVYNNGQYEPAASAQVTTTAQAAPGQQPAMAPQAAGPSAGISFNSQDGTRTVKIVNGDAFLYDTAPGETDNKPFFLASGVKEVKFSNGQNGQPLQILVIFNDGSFQMFDSDGNPFNQGSGGTAAN